MTLESGIYKVSLANFFNKFRPLEVEMKLDYKDSLTRPQKPKKKHWSLHWKFHTLVVGVVGVSSLFVLLESEETQASARVETEHTTLPELSSLDLQLPGTTAASAKPQASANPIPEAKDIATQAVVENAIEWQSATVKRGDTLARIAHREGISAQQIHRLMQTGEEIKTLTQIRPGENIRYQKNDDGELLALSYDISETERLVVSQIDNAFVVSQVDRPYEIHQNRTSGMIEHSMYGAAKESGLSDNLIMDLANIFGYDIDFALDVRKGDTFNLIWDEYYRDGEKVKDGPVLAAEFVNNGRVVRAVRYTDAKGNTDYFTPDGKSLRKAFLRSPVHFTRISSKFNPNRLHPVFKTKRPHRGVDYAARTGTPIYAAGDGKIIFRGVKRGYGNVVIVQHGNKYNTLYAHMSKFNRKARNGTRVKQGQTIGYVGQTGWATGPHLHYEFRVNGVHRNPLTVKLPTAKPLPKKYRDDFDSVSQPLLAQLDTLGRTQLALLDSE